MKQTTVTNVSVDGVVQGLGGLHEDRRGGFEGGGWVLPLFENDNEADHLVDEISLLTYPVVIGEGTRLKASTATLIRSPESSRTNSAFQ